MTLCNGHVQVGKRLSLFQQLLVVQALRPDRLESAMEHFAQRALGLKVGYMII